MKDSNDKPLRSRAARLGFTLNMAKKNNLHVAILAAGPGKLTLTAPTRPELQEKVSRCLTDWSLTVAKVKDLDPDSWETSSNETNTEGGESYV